MSDNKKYYYMRLTENFLDSDAMIVLESLPKGYLYSNILLKMYCKSLRGDGRLMLNDRIPYNLDILARVTRHSVTMIKKALDVFLEHGLIEILDNGAIYMLDIQEFIGKSSTEADRKRAYRARIDGEKDGHIEDKCPDKAPPKYRVQSIEPPISPKGSDDAFEEFWKAYPRKHAQQAALKAWGKLKLTPELLETIFSALGVQKSSDQWRRDNGQYIPLPSTWLNQSRWQDEIEVNADEAPARQFIQTGVSDEGDVLGYWEGEPC